MPRGVVWLVLCLPSAFCGAATLSRLTRQAQLALQTLAPKAFAVRRRRRLRWRYRCQKQSCNLPHWHCIIIIIPACSRRLGRKKLKCGASLWASHAPLGRHPPVRPMISHRRDVVRIYRIKLRLLLSQSQQRCPNAQSLITDEENHVP